MYVRKTELFHHGIKGQKWGVRRFQNKDGTWTAAGKAARRAVDAVESGAKKVGTAIKNRHAKNKEIRRINKLLDKKVSKLTPEELAERKKVVLERKALQDIEKQLPGRHVLKKFIGETADNLAKGMRDKAVNEILNRVAGALAKKDNTTLADYDDKDIRTLDLATIKKLGEAYKNVSVIESGYGKRNAYEQRRFEDRAEEQRLQNWLKEHDESKSKKKQRGHK